MGIKYEVTAVTGKYTDRDGNEKSRYQKVGVILETKNGLMLKMECIPVVEGGWSGFAYLNEPRERDDTGNTSSSGPRGGAPRQQRPQRATEPATDDDFGDSIPFATNRSAW